MNNISTTQQQYSVTRFQNANGSGRMSLFWGVLCDLTIREQVRFNVAWDYLQSISETERNTIYGGPVRNMQAFLLTRQILVLDMTSAQGIVDRFLQEDPELLKKCALVSRKEVLTFVGHMLGRCDEKRRKKLEEYANSRLRTA